jgi:hypothetical protein
VSSVNRYRKGVRLTRTESTIATCTPVSFERHPKDFTMKKKSSSPNLRSITHVQDIAVVQIVKKCHVANGTTSVITEFSSNLRHNSILASTSPPHADYETSPFNVPRFDRRVL